MTVRSRRSVSRLVGPLALFALCTVTGARANAADGFVPSGELPADIAAIPDSSPVRHGTHAVRGNGSTGRRGR